MKFYKNFALIVLIVMFVFTTLTGCAGFGKTADRDDWVGLMSPTQYDNHENAKLAREKLSQATVSADPEKGFEGGVFNWGKRRYNFKITGTENVSHLLDPGESRIAYLLPGSYKCTVYYGGQQVGKPWEFKVNSQMHNVRGRKLHWAVWMEK